MTKLVKILFIFSITTVLFGCSTNSSTKESKKERKIENQIGVKEVAFYAIAKDFEFSEYGLKEMTIHAIDCDSDLTGLICEELKSLVEVGHFLFRNEDFIERTDSSYKIIDGEILLAGIHRPGILKYSINNDSGEFISELSFLLKDQEIVVFIKGIVH